MRREGVLAGAAEGRWAEALASHPGSRLSWPARAAPSPEASSPRTPLNNQASKACERGSCTQAESYSSWLCAIISFTFSLLKYFLSF